MLHAALRMVSATLFLVAYSAASGQSSQSIPAAAYEENPSSGSGPLAVLFSGGDGPDPYVGEAKAFAKEGYVVVLFDSTRFYSYRESPSQTEATVRDLIQRSLKKVEATSTKATVIGYSRGGAIALMFANRMADLVTSVVAYYPVTTKVHDPIAFLLHPRMNVPTLILAGTMDSYKDCCPIARVRALVAAAILPEIGVPLEAHEYPDAGHVFNIPSRRTYRSDYAGDAFTRSLAHIRKFGGNPTGIDGEVPAKSTAPK